MKLKLINLVVILIALSGCADDDKRESISENHPLVGTWETHTMNVQFKSVDGTEADSNWVVNKEVFAEELNLSRSTTVIRDNGTYQEEYWDMEGKLTYDPWGTIFIQGDSITFEQKQPKPKTTKYLFKVDDKEVKFTGYDDADSDGEVDDLVDVVFKRSN